MCAAPWKGSSLANIESVDLKCFLEGIEVPARPTGAAIGVAPNAPVQFQVMFPPVDFRVVKAILPRTHVAVFYRVGSQDTDSPSAWNLMAEGEYLGYGFSKSSAGSMGTILRFAGLENYWQSIYALHFQSMKSAASTAFSEAELVFGTAARVNTLAMEGGVNPLSLRQEIANSLGVTTSSIPEFFVEFLRAMEKKNPFFGQAARRLRLNDRLVSVPDAEIERLAKMNNLANLINGVFSQRPQHSKLLDILSGLMAPLHYGYQVIAMPAASKSGDVRSLWMKPDVPFAAPPRCNVIFPGSVESVDFSRDYMSEPTRIRLALPVVASGAGDSLLRQHFYAPQEMEDISRRVLEMNPEERNLESLLMSGEATRQESREDIKGVIPQIASVSQFDAVTLGSDDKSVHDRYYAGLAEYELLLAQHRGRSMRVSGRFMPNLICGLPAVVIMQHGVVIGNVEGFSHQVFVEGRPTTTVSLSTCREEDLSGVTNPVWKCAAYVDRDKVDATYMELFGVPSVMADAGDLSVTLDTKFSDQMRAAHAIRDAYLASENRESFEKRFTRRPIASQDDLFRFLRSGRTGRDYSGPAFRKEWVDAARVFCAELQSPIQDAT